MFLEYFYWHYIIAPRFLVTFAWRCQRATWQFFSVPTMVKTLFAHWHKDALRYRAAGIGSYITTFLSNQISRAVGFIIRACVLLVWIITEVMVSIFSVMFGLFFLLVPAFIVVGITTSIIYLMAF